MEENSLCGHCIQCLHFVSCYSYSSGNVSPAIQFLKRCLFLFFKWSFFLCWEC
ncbi:unnamed protein product [Brassica rapa subsp. narinosa]